LDVTAIRFGTVVENTPLSHHPVLSASYQSALPVLAVAAVAGPRAAQEQKSMLYARYDRLHVAMTKNVESLRRGVHTVGATYRSSIAQVDTVSVPYSF